MNSQADVTTVSHHPADTAGLLHLVLGRLTWRALAWTLLVACAMELWVAFEFAFDGASPFFAPETSLLEVYGSGGIVNLLLAFTIMLTTLIADELVAKGARRLPTYACAVVLGSGIGAFAQWHLRHWLHLQARFDATGLAPDFSAMQPAIVFCEYLIWGSVIVAIYATRRTALMASARMHHAQLAQARAQRGTLESRLQALQARIEPRFLLNTLAKVRSQYDDHPQSGSRLLEELTVYLRAALPQLRESTSTLERELQLVASYLRIMRVHLGGRLDIDIDAQHTAALGTAVVPPMILLPLVDHMMSATPRPAPERLAIRLTARIVDRRLRLQIDATTGTADPRSPVLDEIRYRLSALYGDAGVLSIGPTDHGGSWAVMEIPHESTDGDHR